MTAMFNALNVIPDMIYVRAHHSKLKMRTISDEASIINMYQFLWTTAYFGKLYINPID